MEAWAQILKGVKTHGLILAALGAVIAMAQAGEITAWMTVFLGCVAASVSTLRFSIKTNGGKE